MMAGPPASGVRLDWEQIPARVRAAIERWLGAPVVAATSQPGGFSPGVAARLRAADGRRAFLKAAGPRPNPDTPVIHRREARIVAALPPAAPVPRLLWSYDEGPAGWVALAFEDVAGRQPDLPWREADLARALDALADLAACLTPAPAALVDLGGLDGWYVMRRRWWPLLRDAPPDGLDAWSRRHAAAAADLEATAAAAARGTTLLHLDLRADNLLLTADRALVVDWPAARTGAPWVDAAFFAPSVAMQGGPDPEALLARYPPARSANPAAVTAVAAAIAGFFTHQALQPAPPGLPTLRAFQAAQGAVAREWLARRTGWA